MRVDFTGSGLEPPEKSTTGRAGHAEATGTGTGTEAGSGASNVSGVDQTHFSFDQTRVQSLEAHVLAQPEIREAKVQSLQQAIGSGEYSVPASQVADALVSEFGGAKG
jgi:flagellar biosynthesis anti-sigma factor FlgM